MFTHIRLLWHACLSTTFSLIFPVMALATPQNINPSLFENVTPDDFPSYPTTIEQDSQGFLWIGTRQGLFRYDGYEFRHFIHLQDDPHSVAGNYITSLWAAEDGKLWIGTRTGGASVYDPYSGKFRNYRHDPENNESLRNNRVDVVLGNNQGHVWLGTRNGLTRFDTVSGKMTHFQPDDNDPNSISYRKIRALAYDLNGDLLIGHDRGLERFKHDRGHFERIRARSAEGDRLKDEYVRRIFVTPPASPNSGQIWLALEKEGLARIGQDGRLVIYPIDINQPLALASSHITEFLLVEPETLWVGAQGGGIVVIDLHSNQIVRRIPDGPLTAPLKSALLENEYLFKDKSGLIWVGAEGLELMRFNPTSQAFKTLRTDPAKATSLSSDLAWGILQRANGELWVLHKGTRGIDILNGQLKRVDHIDLASAVKDPGYDSKTIIEDSAGNVWLGLHRGLFKYQASTKRFTRYENTKHFKIWGLVERDAILWLATDKGLYRFAADTGKLTPWQHKEDAGMQSHAFYKIGKDSDGNLWAATRQRIYRLAYGDSHWQLLKDYNYETARKSGNEIRHISLDGKSRLWVSLRRNIEIMSHWQTDRLHVENLRQQDGVPHLINPDGFIADAEGKMWSTDGYFDTALSRYTPLRRIDGVDIGDHSTGCYEKLSENRLIFCGTKGLLVFDTRQIQRWDYQSPLVITRLSVDNENMAIPDNNSLTLPAGTLSFSVEFSALDYSDPKSNRYAYRLLGFENQWHEVSAQRRQARYTNLAPGDYVLEIKGSNRLGDWSRNNISLDVVVIPFWYQTLAARIGLTLGVLLLFVLIYFFRITQLKRHEAVLERQVAERTREVSEKSEALERSYARIEESNTKLAHAMAHLEEISNRDELTGLFNRRYLSQQIAQDIALVHRRYQTGRNEDADLVLMLLDIDFFKKVNDDYGHDSGDALLKQFADQLRGLLRETDTIVRWGGEEFLVVMRLTSLQQTQSAAERIRAAIAEQRFDLGNDVKINITCSIGYASYPCFKNTPAETLSWQDTLKIADVALYLAKELSRDTYIGFHPKAGGFTRESYQNIIDDPVTAFRDGLLEIIAPEKTLKSIK